MPISDAQGVVLRLLAKNRSSESYLAGATVLHRQLQSPRYSQDLDFFHDLADSIASSAEQDVLTLREAGHEVTWLLRTPVMYQALVTVGGGSVKLEWAQDSAFRFFPIRPDPLFGYCLDDADAAVNKMLALAGRTEIRDFVDVLHLHEHMLSVGALAWAACGKDPGYTPDFLLDQTARHTAYTQDDLERLALRESLDLRDLKRRWLEALNEARELVRQLPAGDVGCLYLGKDGRPVEPKPGTEGFKLLTRHRGSVKGAWPRVEGFS